MPGKDERPPVSRGPSSVLSCGSIALLIRAESTRMNTGTFSQNRRHHSPDPPHFLKNPPHIPSAFKAGKAPADTRTPPTTIERTPEIRHDHSVSSHPEPYECCGLEKDVSFTDGAPGVLDKWWSAIGESFDRRTD